jgi:hypothetical protein
VRGISIKNMKARPPETEGLKRNGGDEEDRTPGLGIANAALSQLSYIPERS